MKIKTLALSALFAAAALGTAQADTLVVNFAYLGPTYDYGPVTLTVSTPSGYQLTASPFLVSNITMANSFAAFCLEPFQALSGSSLTIGDPSYNSGAPLSTPVNIAAIQTLYNRYYADALSTPVKASAFQFAIWELASDTGADLNAGPNFAMPSAPDPAVKALAQQMLDGTAAQTPALYNLVQWSSLGSQDMIQAIPVPEASTYAMMLLGLAGIGAVAKRRRH